MAASLTAAGKDFQEVNIARNNLQNSQVKNVVYVVSDGIETCGGDPVAAAKKLHESHVNAIVNVIGFDVDDAAAAQLEAVAKAGGGEWVRAKNKREIMRAYSSSKMQYILRYNCQQTKQLSSHNKTQTSQTSHFNCLQSKAIKEHNRIQRQVIKDVRQGVISQTEKDYVLKKAKQKQDDILNPAKDKMQIALKSAHKRLNDNLTDAKNQRDDDLERLKKDAETKLQDDRLEHAASTP